MGSMMEKPLTYSLLKISLLGLILIFSVNLFAQTTLVAIESPVLVSTDKEGNIYLALENGAIDKYSLDGELLNHFSPEQLAEATLIEAWNPLRIFVFYQDFQEYVFLDRFLTSANRFSLNHISSYIGMATVSLDNNLWVIDYSSFSLKKYNVNFEQVTIERPLDLILDPDDYDITFMSEYQNLLFVADRKKGVLVFDNLGNYLREFAYENLEYFNFLEDELYFVNEEKVKFVNIYSGDKREAVLDEETRFVIVNKTSTVTISDQTLKISN